MDGTIWDHFSIVRDPRIERQKKHQLKDILVITPRTCVIRRMVSAYDDLYNHGPVVPYFLPDPLLRVTNGVFWEIGRIIIILLDKNGSFDEDVMNICSLPEYSVS